MLEQISWEQYLIGGSLVIIGYYLVIGGLFFRKEIRAFINKRLLGGSRHRQLDEMATEEAEEDAAFEEVKSVVVDLKYSVLEKAGKNIDKDELLENLKERLSSYDGLRRPAFQIPVNDFIVSNAKKINGVVISEDDLDAMWRSLPRN